MGDIAGVNYTMLDGVEEMLLKPTNGGPEQLMRVRRARVRTPDTSVLVLGVAQWTDGRIDVRTLEVVRGASEYDQLVSKYRIGLYALDERTSYMEITDLQPGADGELAATRVDLGRVAELAGGMPELTRLCKVEHITISPKANIPGVGKARQGFLAAQFPSSRQSAAVAAYILARVVPVSLTITGRPPWPERDRLTATSKANTELPTEIKPPVTTKPRSVTPRESIPARTLEAGIGSTTPVPTAFSGGKTPTSEQKAIIDFAGRAPDLAIEALAGTGKTSTLRMFAESIPGLKGQYLAFNRAIVQEAATSFPTSVDCKTAHGLAMRAMGFKFRHRLNSSRVTNHELSDILQCKGFGYRTKETNRFLGGDQIARYALDTVARFCKSLDGEVSRAHVPLAPMIVEDSETARAYADHVLPYAQRIWEDVSNPEGTLPYNHDYYLKLWQLSSPRINKDYILFDEAQDADPVMLSIVNAQGGAQLVYCGDDFQSLYEWRGAKNALELAHVDERLWLTQSFRFGRDIADLANEFLKRLQSPKPLRGNPAMRSKVGPIARPSAIMCRTNTAVMQTLIDADKNRQKAAVVGGARDLDAFAAACAQLKSGHRTNHPDLAPFRNWEDVEEWMDDSPEQSPDVIQRLKLIDKFGPAVIQRLIKGLVSEEHADVIASTVHQAKGREWPTVRLAGDFMHPDDMEPEDLRVAYVAITRGRHGVDIGSLFTQERKDKLRPDVQPTRAFKQRPPITFR